MRTRLLILLSMALAAFGLGTEAKASIPMDVKAKIMQVDDSSRLILDKAFSNQLSHLEAGHYSHQSHQSHYSHQSHRSHYSSS